MNNIYKVVWSKCRGCFVVVSELGSADGKGTSNSIILTTTSVALAFLGFSLPFYANAYSLVFNGSGPTVFATSGCNIAVLYGATQNCVGSNSTAIGGLSSATGSNSVAFGDSATASGDSSAALGANSTAGAVNSVALGYGSVVLTGLSGGTAGATTINNTTIGGTTFGGYAGSGASGGILSVGKVGSERRIQNVAAGLISGTSTDAINGSQLYAVASAVTSTITSLSSSTSTGLSTTNSTVTSLSTSASTGLSSASSSITSLSTGLSST
ncbi:ESPR-type extended signal peptide-containing protein, partial [Burkholderia cepacia]|uniref:ESPR-type extended signal peptide-containing protein n=1 Tax=Burkholderia cepacia TaxID=292 RepID=UPI003B589547